MSARSDVYQQLVEVLVERFGHREADLGPDVYLFELDLDSLSTVGVIDVLEQLLGVAIDEEHFEIDQTLGEIVEMLEERVGTSA